MRRDYFLLKQRSFKGFRSALSATNEQNIGINNSDAEYCARFGYVPLANATEAWFETYDGKTLSDIYIKGSLVVVSEKAKAVFSTFHVDDYLHWMPAHMVDEQRRPVGEMMLGYAKWEVDAVDYPNSEVRYFGNSTHVLDVTKYAFIPQELPAMDLFYTPQDNWIATKPLVEALVQARIVGFHAKPIWSGEVPD
jgi:hypothetical protein